MSEKQRFDDYLRSVLEQVPPGPAAEQYTRQALDEYQQLVKAIANSKADVMVKETRIEDARASLMATLWVLIDTEQPDGGHWPGIPAAPATATAATNTTHSTETEEDNATR